VQQQPRGATQCPQQRTSLRKQAPPRTAATSQTPTPASCSKSRRSSSTRRSRHCSRSPSQAASRSGSTKAKWVEFYNQLASGKPAQITVTVHVAGTKTRHRRDKEGDVDAVVQTKSLIVTDVHLEETD
jgi:hypothetical protein